MEIPALIQNAYHANLVYLKSIKNVSFNSMQPISSQHNAHIVGYSKVNTYWSGRNCHWSHDDRRICNHRPQNFPDTLRRWDNRDCCNTSVLQCITIKHKTACSPCSSVFVLGFVTLAFYFDVVCYTMLASRFASCLKYSRAMLPHP